MRLSIHRIDSLFSAVILLTVSFLYVSCKKEQETKVPDGQFVSADDLLSGETESTVISVDSSSPISISSAWISTVVPTKGAGESTISSIRTQKFGLFAWWNRQEDYFNAVLTGHEWLENSSVTYIETADGRDRWSCDPKAWWPLGCNLSFFAYAPYMDCTGPMLVLPNGELSYLPRGTFTQDTDPAAQVDFCMSHPVMDRNKSQGDVPVDLWHALTKVLFYVNLGGELYPGDDHQYRVKSLQLDGIVPSNKFTFNARNAVRWDDLPRTDLSTRTQTYNLSVASGTLVEEPTPFVWDMAGETGLNKYKCINGLEDGKLFLLPQPMTPEAVATLVVEKGYWSAGVWSHTADLEPFVVNLPVETVWKSSQTVCYSITLDITQWEPTEFSVTLLDWSLNPISGVTFPVI